MFLFCRFGHNSPQTWQLLAKGIGLVIQIIQTIICNVVKLIREEKRRVREKLIRLIFDFNIIEQYFYGSYSNPPELSTHSYQGPTISNTSKKLHEKDPVFFDPSPIYAHKLREKC
jgi:hypothetical protein